jgi:hypothetical protein
MVKVHTERMPMREVSVEEYLQFLNEVREVVVEDTRIPLTGHNENLSKSRGSMLDGWIPLRHAGEIFYTPLSGGRG